MRADLSGLTTSTSAQTSQDGTVYWTIVFSIELYLGLTEFKARIKWNDDVRFTLITWVGVGHSDPVRSPGESKIVSAR